MWVTYAPCFFRVSKIFVFLLLNQSCYLSFFFCSISFSFYLFHTISSLPNRMLYMLLLLLNLFSSPGKNTGEGCHFLLQCMKLKSESEVAQLCLTCSDPMDCSLPGSSIHGIFQARVLGVEWHCLLWILPIAQVYSIKWKILEKFT